MPSKRLSRRDLLKIGATVSAAELAATLLPGCSSLKSALTSTSPSTSCSKITDIDHVVIFIQENRSFDHYFGSYRGVRGFSDISSAFRQPYPQNTSNSPSGVLLPFHLDTSNANAFCTSDIDHGWVSQHQSWNNGAMNGFVTARYSGDPINAPLTMGYYTRADLPLYYAVADAFTLCDNFFCSAMGPTDPNRLYSMAGSIDPDGKNGGPITQTLVSNRPSMYGKLTYTTMPEQLQAHGISWKVYNSPDQSILNGTLSDNVLAYFKNFQDPSSTLYKNAFNPQFPIDFLADAAGRNLPQVSWILASNLSSDHPPAPPILGELALASVIGALTASPSQWARTALFLSYDENGGFFDHVPPPTAPAGTSGEYLTVPAVPDPTATGSINGPIGLGMRVPALIISPFSRGGFISSDVFDHTSILRFLETRFGAEVPNLSAWRRATVGDMTSAFNFGKLDTSVPSLPSLSAASSQFLNGCLATLTGTSPNLIPNPQTSPTQETGTPTRPGGVC